jgi:hypothetical protein
MRQLTVDRRLTGTRVTDQRLVLLDYRVAERPGDGRGVVTASIRCRLRSATIPRLSASRHTGGAAGGRHGDPAGRPVLRRGPQVADPGT